MRRITLKNLNDFLNTMVTWFHEGGEPVETSEAIRRTQICVNCPENAAKGYKGKCPGCFSRKALMFLYGFKNGRGVFEPSVLPLDDIPDRDKLFYCKKCGCDCILKAFVPLGVIAEENIESFPVECWVRQGHKKTPPASEETSGDTT